MKKAAHSKHSQSDSRSPEAENERSLRRPGHRFLAAVLLVLFFLLCLSGLWFWKNGAGAFSAKAGGASAQGRGRAGREEGKEGEETEEERACSLSGRIRNSAEMIAGIRKGLREHSAAITVSFDCGSDVFADLNDVIGNWMEAAQAETDSPVEGDYIRYQLGGYVYNSTSRQEDGRWYYRVRIEPTYYHYLSQEEETDRAVSSIRRKFFFMPWTSREKKIRKIYDYLCENVSYDKVHRKNPYYHKCSTAYAALVQGTASCQGYCTALYRLLREEEIPCRIVTGTAEGEVLHAWVIVQLREKWYLLDPTWDAGAEEYRFYLAGTAGTEDHVPGERFRTESFLEEHPMAETAYFQ